MSLSSRIRLLQGCSVTSTRPAYNAANKAHLPGSSHRANLSQLAKQPAENSGLFAASSPTLWRSTKARSLSRDSFLDVLKGDTPAAYVPGLVSREHARKFEDHLVPKLVPYDHIAGPGVDKVGLAQFEFQAQSSQDFQNRGTDAKDRYFAKASELGQLHENIGRATGCNAWARVVALLRDMFPEYDVGPATEPDGRQYHAGIYRCINDSTPIHCDWSPFDSKTEDWVINRITRQAVFNLYLAPMTDGETVLYDRQWADDVLEHRDPDTYGYFPRAVQGRACTTLRPNVGDVWFFNTRNLHEVKAIGWEEHEEHGRWRRPRLTMSSFIGLLPAGIVGDRPKIILWS